MTQVIIDHFSQTKIWIYKKTDVLPTLVMKQFVQNTRKVSNHYKGLSQHKGKCKDDKPRGNTVNSTLDANKELSNSNAILGNHSIDDPKLIISASYEDAVKSKKSLLMLSILDRKQKLY